MYLISKNMTTIEYYEGLPSRVSKQDDTRDDVMPVSTSNAPNANRHIYDVGMRENIRQVFGDDWKSCCIPCVQSNSHSGTSFPTNTIDGHNLDKYGLMRNMNSGGGSGVIHYV